MLLLTTVALSRLLSGANKIRPLGARFLCFMEYFWTEKKVHVMTLSGCKTNKKWIQNSDKIYEVANQALVSQIAFLLSIEYQS